MTEPHYTRNLRWYLHNTLLRCESDTALLQELQSWINVNYQACGEIWPADLLDIFDKYAPGYRRRRSKGYQSQEAQEERLTFVRKVREALSEHLGPNSGTNEPYIVNMRRLSTLMGVSALQAEILIFCMEVASFEPITRFAQQIKEVRRSAERTLSVVLAASDAEVHKALNDPDNGLIAMGLLVRETRWHCPSDFPLNLSSKLRKTAWRPFETPKEFLEAIIGPPCRSELCWDDFKHMGADRETICKMLEGSFKRRSIGINVLLHGKVGTGKTEFVRSLGSKMNCEVYSVGESDEQGEEPSSRERIADLLFAQRVLSGRPRSVILFDEMEDILGQSFLAFGKERGVDSKVFVNRAIEETPVPIIWTANTPGMLGAPVIRRMNLVTEMQMPNAEVRSRLMQRICSQYELNLSSEAIERLATRYAVPPAIAAKSVETAALAELSEEGLADVLDNLASAAGFRRDNEAHWNDPRLPAFEPSLLNITASTLEPGELIDRLREQGPGPWSILFSGPPGTGKSAFLRHLAAQMGMGVLLRRASDLLDMFVGGTEAKIEEAFRQAAKERKFLIIDEADSFLQDRRGAVRSWEVTQVNQLLTCMEAHPLPFGFTTNLLPSLDKAAFRRLTFKLEAGFLTINQTREAFEHFFEVSAPAGLGDLDGLTPGDFAVVKKRALLLGLERDSEALVQMLADDLAAKKSSYERKGPMGFGRPVSE